MTQIIADPIKRAYAIFSGRNCAVPPLRVFAEAVAAYEAAKPSPASLPADKEKELLHIFTMDCGPGISLHAVLNKGMAEYYPDDGPGLRKCVDWIKRQVCKNAASILTPTSGAETKPLGYVNVYRRRDGELELGSTDLDETPDEPAHAAAFVEVVGKAAVYLHPASAPPATVDAERDALRAALRMAEAALQYYATERSFLGQQARDALSTIRATLTGDAQAETAEKRYRLHRFVDGVKMAEGASLSRPADINQAFSSARKMYGNPAGMDFVLYEYPAQAAPSLIPMGVKCTGCGSAWDDARLTEERAKNPGMLSCCPERKVVEVFALKRTPAKPVNSDA